MTKGNINGKEYDFATSRITGGHYTFLTKRGNLFQNKMDVEMSVTLKPTDVVADVGAYVGEFSLYASKAGVSKVLTYEATPDTFELLKLNKTDKMEIFNKAVVGTDDEYVDFYYSTGIGVTNSVAKTQGKGGKLTVPAIRYEEAIKDATVVKIDVEGAEYSYNIIQPHVRAYIIEFHPIVGVDWKANVSKIINDLETSGYQCIRTPGFTTGWDMHGSWVKGGQ